MLITTWWPCETGATSGTDVLAKAGTAASRNRLNPNFFMMLFADSVCEVRHHTATAGNLWENVVFLFGFGVRAWHYGNSDEKAG